MNGSWFPVPIPHGQRNRSSDWSKNSPAALISAHTRHRLGRTIRATHKFHQRGLLKRAHHAVMAVLGTLLVRQASGAVTVVGSRACLTKISGVVVDAGEMSRFQLLSDAQWSLIADLLPARTGKQGMPFRDARQVGPQPSRPNRDLAYRGRPTVW